jgi:hypothetical protein
MKKSPPRNRRRSLSGAAKTAGAEAQELDPRANGDARLSAALKSFEALTVGNQLHFLALVLRDEIGDKACSSVAPAGVEQERVAPSELPTPELPTPELPTPELPTPANPVPALAAPPAAVPDHSGAELPAPLAAPAAAGLAKLQIVESDESAQYGQRSFPLPVRISDVRPPSAAAVHPASFPMVSIVMTMICSFALTLGVMLWHRQSDASASQNPAPLAPPARPFAAPIPPSTPSWPAIRQAVAPAQPQNSPPPAAPAYAPQYHDEPANDLPVELAFRRRPVAADGEHFNRFNWHLTGRIHNLSHEPLTVDVSVEGEEGPSYAQVFVDSDSDAEFGSNDGLEIHPNDRITLHSPPYSDVVQQVR